MAEQQLPRKIESIDEIAPKGAIQAEKIDSLSSVEEAQRVKFDQALEKVQQNQKPLITQSEIKQTEPSAIKPSLMELAGQQKNSATNFSYGRSVEKVQLQAARTKEAFEKPRALLMGQNQADFSSLASPNLLQEMNYRIEHADTLLQAAMQETRGVEVGSTLQKEKRPLERFLSFLTDGDHRTNAIVNDIQQLQAAGKGLSPAILLGVQMKLGFVQQELEFFTSTLNKMLESVKTIMNVQI